MAEGGLNPWCDEHWNRIRMDPHYNSIAAAFRLPELALDTPGFRAAVDEDYGGDLQAAMADLSPLCCWLEDREQLEIVYADVRMDEPTDVEAEVREK